MEHDKDIARGDPQRQLDLVVEDLLRVVHVNELVCSPAVDLLGGEGVADVDGRKVGRRSSCDIDTKKEPPLRPQILSRP